MRSVFVPGSSNRLKCSFGSLPWSKNSAPAVFLCPLGIDRQRIRSDDRLVILVRNTAGIVFGEGNVAHFVRLLAQQGATGAVVALAEKARKSSRVSLMSRWLVRALNSCPLGMSGPHITGVSAGADGRAWVPFE